MLVRAATFGDGEGKRLAELIVRSIRAAVLAEGWISEAEFDGIVGRLQRFAYDPSTVIGLPRIFGCSPSTPCVLERGRHEVSSVKGRGRDLQPGRATWAAPRFVGLGAASVRALAVPTAAAEGVPKAQRETTLKGLSSGDRNSEERRADDLSVDHPHLVDNYRGAHRLAESSRSRSISTEDQRQAMQHFRGVFDELLGDEPVERGGGGRAAGAYAPRDT